jgi:hypothetical protein
LREIQGVFVVRGGAHDGARTLATCPHGVNYGNRRIFNLQNQNATRGLPILRNPQNPRFIPLGTSRDGRELTLEGSLTETRPSRNHTPPKLNRVLKRVG